MAATRSRSGGVRVATLTSLFVGLNAAIVVEAGLLSQRAEPAATTADPAAAMARQPDSRPAEPAGETAAPAGVDDDETTPDVPEPGPDAAEPPAQADAVTPADDEDPVTPIPDAAPAGRPAADLPGPRWTPEQLQASMLRVPEVSLAHPAALTVPRTGRATRDVQPLLAILDARPDLRGLPTLRGPGVQLSRAESDAFRDTSVLLRKGLGEALGQRGRPNRRLIVRPEVLTARPAVVARVLHQMLQVESVPLRKLLLHQLTAMRDPAASRALAHRAVYEPVEELRHEAVHALARRPAAEYLPALLEAFANPWAPAADYAADALIALAPADAVPELIHRLDGPDPSAALPGDGGSPVVRELVRVNHARNCVLCHAQSVSSRDNIRVGAPSPVRPLPSPFSLATYEGGGRGGSQTPPDTVFVRPDVTYLKQDFSWVLPVASPGPWPALQRFDFLLRTRPAAAGELTPSGGEIPQRQAVVRALRALTGRDFGDRAADWRAGLAAATKGR